jgi:hypothetical protein
MLGTFSTVLCMCMLVASQESHSLEDILKAWKAKEQAVRSFKVQWTEARMLPKGGRMPAGPSPNGQEQPPKDVTYEIPYEVIIDQEKSCIKYTSKSWSDDKAVDDERTTSFDGKNCRILTRTGYTAWPQATIRKEHYNIELDNFHILPVMMCIRPFHMGTKEILPISKLTHRGIVDIRGNKCIKLSATKSSESELIFYVDPASNFSIVRYESWSRGSLSIAMDIDYAKHGSEWYPSAWKLLWQYSNGILRESGQATVRHLAVNESVSSEVFALEFPTGTRVTDATSDPQLHYIVKDKGQKRMIPMEDMGATYEAIVNTEPGSAHQWQKPSSLNYLLIACCCGLGLLCVLAFWRFRRRHV